MEISLLHLAALLLCICAVIETYCPKTGYETYLGTKSPYRAVSNITSSRVNYKGCKPTKFWAFIRHGTRNPNAKIIAQWDARLPEIRDALLANLQRPTEHIHASDLDAFRKWTNSLEENQEKKLTHEGEDEMIELAERFQIRFPQIFEGIYSNTSYKFKFTATQRTKRSAQYFAAGLFGKRTVADIEFPAPLKKDPILRFYKLCNKWRRDVSKNPRSYWERRKFENSTVMARTLASVSKRMGLPGKLDLTDLYSIFMTCAFETAWSRKRRSPWCAPFTVDDFKAMEYSEDLKYYWVDGYGHELTYKQACPAFKDLMNTFTGKSAFPKATLYFTHSGTLLKMLSHMHLYKEKKPLTADDFARNAKRQWRVSKIDAFGTNLAFVLFECTNKQRKVLTMHQENVVRLPGCPNEDLCDINKLIKYYNKSIYNCEFDEMCENLK